MCHNLLKNKKKFERINQREERRRSETKGDRRNQYKLPTKWKMFLQDTTKSEELFSLLTEKVKIFSFQKIRR